MKRTKGGGPLLVPALLVEGQGGFRAASVGRWWRGHQSREWDARRTTTFGSRADDQQGKAV